MRGTISGLDVPLARLVLGTMSLDPADPDANWALLDHYVALGGNALDTAHIYGRGAADRIVGEWMALRGNRERIVVIGKGAHPLKPGEPRVTPEDITADLLQSLAWLRTDYIDLYLLHRDDPSTPVGPLIDCLNEHRHAGRIRAFGASNWSASRIAEANAYAASRELAGFVVSSPNLSLAVPNEVPWPGCVSLGIEGTAWYQETGFPVLSWSSQAQGFFTGRYEPEDRSDVRMVRTWYSDANFRRLARARELAERMGATANQVALAYVLRQPFPTFAAIGPRTLEELRSSFAALQVDLSPAEARWLNLEIG